MLIEIALESNGIFLSQSWKREGLFD